MSHKKLEKLPEALRVYGIDLKSNRNFEPFEGLETGNWIPLQMAMDSFGNIHFRKGETYEKDLENVQNELVEAKKTVKTQEKTIKSQEKQIASLKKASKTATKKSETVEEQKWPED